MLSFEYTADKTAIKGISSTVLYDGEKAYQLDTYGQRISAMSYGAFGEDAYNARRCYEWYLKQADLAWCYMHNHGVDEITVDIDDEDNAVIVPVYQVWVCSGNKNETTGTITYGEYNDKREGEKAFASYCEDAEMYFLDSHQEPPASFKDRVIRIYLENEVTNDLYDIFQYGMVNWEAENK